MVVCERDDDDGVTVVMLLLTSLYVAVDVAAAAAFVTVEATASLVEGRDDASSAAYAGLFREDMTTDETVADSIPWRSVRRLVSAGGGVADVVVVAGADVIVIVGE
jgi:hypothetical protein